MTRYRMPSTLDMWTRQDVERKQAPRMTPRLAVAHHEAAHAIAAIYDGLRVDSIEVNDRGAGKCCHQSGRLGGTTKQRLQWLRREMRIVAAGQEGQRWVDPHGTFRTCSLDRSDLAELKLMAEILTGDHTWARDMIAEARLTAGELIDGHWVLVERVAKALDKHGRLTGDEISELLGSEPEPRPSNWGSGITWGEADGYFLPPSKPETKKLPPPDAKVCDLVTRAFRQRHGVNV